MRQEPERRKAWLQKSWVLIFFPILKLGVHLVTVSGYGYFRDEFYYLACSHHPSTGYVDQPALSILLLWLVRHLLGSSLFALRLLPALAGALTVGLVGVMTRRLGGGRFAQVLAMSAAIAAPIYLALDHFYSMNAFDLLFWAGTAYLLIRLFENPGTRLWIALGLWLGLGLENKISILWLGAGIAVGLLATRQRRLLKTAGPWLAGLTALLLFAPYLLWQLRNHWATLEFIRNATSFKMASVSFSEFAVNQVLFMNPVTALIWVVGLAGLLLRKQFATHRPLAWIYITVFVLLAASGSSRPGYLAPACTWLLAAGSVVWEEWAKQAGRAWLGPLLLLSIWISGGVLAPLALPVLPVQSYIGYAKTLGIGPSTEEKKQLGALPQFYADMHGWDSIVHSVASAYEALPDSQKSQACIFARNYGEAGAIDLLGGALGLPRAISGHNNYWLWGPGDCSGKVLIVLGGEKNQLLNIFSQVHQAGSTHCGYCMPYENHLPIWVCLDSTISIQELWPRVKNFN